MSSGLSVQVLLPPLLCLLCRVENEQQTGRLSATVGRAVGLAAAALALESIGFWLIRKPPRAYVTQLVAAARRLRTLLIIQLLTGVSLMALPFYMVHAREEMGAPPEAVGWFLLVQVTGGVLGNLLWARLVDRINSRTMLTACAVTSTAAPLLAMALGPIGWWGLLPTSFLAGAAFNGRRVGFQSALLELAPATKRPTFAALNTVLILPLAVLPLLAGLLLQVWSYPALFALTAGFVGLGAVWTRKL